MFNTNVFCPNQNFSLLLHILLTIVIHFFKLIFILFAISIVSFWICNHTNTDPIEQWCMMQHNENEGIGCVYSENANLRRKALGLDLPLFYIDISTWAEPDTIYKISDKKIYKAAMVWLQNTGDWEKVNQYLKEVYALSQEYQIIKNQHLSDSNYFEYKQIELTIYGLSTQTDKAEVEINLSTIKAFYQKNHLSSPTLLQLTQSTSSLFDKKFNIKNYIPKISFFGFKNQYHIWLCKAIQGDWGKSYRTNEAVSERIAGFVGRSAMFSLLSFLLGFCIAIPLAILKVAYHGSFFDKLTDNIIFIINSLPTFVIGIFLILLFSNPDVFNWFLPAYSYNGTWISRATLPLITYAINPINYLTILIKSLLLNEMQQDYIRTARAKGLSEKLIYFRHAFRNILVPLFTSSAGLLPSLMGGSMALEYVFSIGGMGEEAFIAVQSLDIPMILTIMTITGFLTVLGYIITDTLSRFVDKRIS